MSATSRTAASMVLLVPPTSCMLSTGGRLVSPPAAADLHELLIVEQIADRGGFAAEADQHVAADIGMPRDAPHHAIERGMTFAAELHAAAAAVREGHHAVDVRIVPECLRVEPCRDVLADRGRAIDRRDDGDVVARARFAIGAPIALERDAGERRGIGRNLAGRGIVAGELVRR